MTVISETPHAH